ncbi:glycosyltransferase [Actinomadura sp. 21ATH]|uniref:glycosyltransferase n=1 Tax=Actinomadura sp. 21ATH TaxID=1735444 RepID=UPI0035BFDF5C
MEEAPSARYARSRTLFVVGSLPLIAFAVWGGYHLATVVGAFGRLDTTSLAAAWLMSFLAQWWVPLAWLERPFPVRPESLVVTVQIPVYNEDPATLRACLRSVLAQSRRPDRVRVVNDGSVERGVPVKYARIRKEFLREARALGVRVTWDRTENRGKRFAQMHVLADDDADIFVTLDSDSVLDRHAIREGLAPFADPKVRSVAGQVLVLNRTANPLTRLTGVLYLPFTRGLRSAQSVLRRVTINSGTLAFYRGDVVRRYAGVYENERFAGRPMQMNDDSMLTFYALLEGDTVHQPSALVFTLVPERFGHYFNQQLRWMRGTTVRHLWWLRYMPLTGVVFWTTVAEYAHLVLAIVLPVTLVMHDGHRGDLGAIGAAALQIGLAMNYLVALRLFTVRRSDEPLASLVLAYVLSPVASLWRLLVLRPLYLYAMVTCRRIGRWGTRDGVEVALAGRGA